MEMLVYGGDGMKPYRECYRVMDPFVVYLKRYWSIYMEKEMLTVDNLCHLMWRLHKNVMKRHLKNFFQELLQVILFH